jgi:hypothetical protein
VAERLKQMPMAAPAATAPDPQKQPIEYINHVLGQVQNSTAELQQWRQQQEQAATQRAQVQQYAAWTQAQEQEFAKTVPEYREAYQFAMEARDKELQALGFAEPAMRAAIARQNTLEIINNAVQLNKNPAELVWAYAKARGYNPKGAKPAGGETEAQAKIAAGLQVAGAKLKQGGTAGEGELQPKDLAGITDPEEFEKAWKKVFGKRR